MKLALRRVAFLITVFSSLGLYAADENECIDGGKLMHLDAGGSGGYDVTLSRDKTFLVIGKYDGDSFKVFDLKTKQIKEFQKPSGSMISILKNNEIAYSKFDRIDTSSASSALKTLKKSKTTMYASRSSNIFIFPDEDEYKKNVTDVLKVPVDVSSKLFVKKPDGSQAPYSIEEAH